VIARNSSSHYKGKSLDAKQFVAESLECDICWKEACAIRPHTRISAQTRRCHIGKPHLAERYDLELTELFAIQDAIARARGGAIEPELLRTEGAQAVARHTGNMTAWDLVPAWDMALSSGHA